MFSKYQKIRQTQFIKEKEIDDILNQHKKSCPGPIIKYLLRLRKINRNMSNNLYNSSFLDYIKILDDNLKWLDNHQENFNRSVKNADFCNGLKMMLDRTSISGYK